MNGGLWRDPETFDGLFPRPEPQPVPGCADCLGYARTRNTARNSGDYSRASDMNVLMRRHQTEVTH